jgi:tetratricopeptide (TPR) repeat protein
LRDTLTMDEAFRKYFEPTAEKWFEIGNDMSNSGQSDKAVEAYQEGLKLDPQFPPILFNLACIYEELKEDQQALDLLDRFLTICPDRFGLFKKSVLLSHLGRMAEARVIYLEAERSEDQKDQPFCINEQKKAADLLK